jgi:tetratricopeptide (TPR) repeat protein
LLTPFIAICNTIHIRAACGYNQTDSPAFPRYTVPVSEIPADSANQRGGAVCPDPIKMDKIAGLKEILALDPKSSFARYGIAMELVKRGETAAALEEFDTLIANDPDYTAGYFMAAQTLAKAGRNEEAIGRLKAGINCAARAGNRHALSEMQTMLDELDG